jgi:4a-hydroxytetrahydrobiopterin dehydratase
MEVMSPRDQRLSDDEVGAALGELRGWARSGDEIEKTFECPSFPDAIAFVVRVGFLAERAGHHPDLDIRWRKVRVALTTHDAGGLTARDLDLARQIEQVA